MLRTRFFAAIAALVLAAIPASIAHANAQTYGDWRTQSVGDDILIAETRADRMALFLACRRGDADTLRLNIVVAGDVPAFADFPGPIAQFSFGNSPELNPQYLAVRIENGDNPNRVFSIVASNADLRPLVQQLRRANTLTLTLFGGPDQENIEGAQGALSLRGSSAALGMVSQACS